jgi:hypothetical protein
MLNAQRTRQAIYTNYIHYIVTLGTYVSTLYVFRYIHK